MLQLLVLIGFVLTCANTELSDRDVDQNYLGCFNDISDERDLPYKYVTEFDMTPKLCLDLCKSKKLKYAGVQNGVNCYCGDSYGHHGIANETDCNTPCGDDYPLNCGGPSRNSIYETGETDSLDSARLGCFIDKNGDNDLPTLYSGDAVITRHFCYITCRRKNFKFAAVQQGKYCYCGDSYGRHGKVADAECDVPCVGDQTETCGGKRRNEVFRTGNGKELETRVLGCFKDELNWELRDAFDGNEFMTRHFCVLFCKQKNFKYAATQGGKWCFCADTYAQHDKVPDSECSMPCAGDAGETCGNLRRNLVFETGVQKSIETLVLGCYKNEPENDLPEVYNGDNLMTRHLCLSYCKKKNFKYAGVQYGRWCHCGDSYGRYGKVTDSECSMPCNGDAGETCGNLERNLVFETGVNKSIHRLILKNCLHDSTYQQATCDLAIDGNFSSNSNGEFKCSHSALTTGGGWWKAELEQEAFVNYVVIYNRRDRNKDRLTDFDILLDDSYCATYKSEFAFVTKVFFCNQLGKVIKIVSRREHLTLCEVEVFGTYKS